MSNPLTQKQTLLIFLLLPVMTKPHQAYPQQDIDFSLK